MPGIQDLADNIKAQEKIIVDANLKIEKLRIELAGALRELGIADLITGGASAPSGAGRRRGGRGKSATLQPATEKEVLKVYRAAPRKSFSKSDVRKALGKDPGDHIKALREIGTLKEAKDSKKGAGARYTTA